MIDWRDPQLLSRFITERGKIVPRRVSGITAKNQHKPVDTGAPVGKEVW